MCTVPLDAIGLHIRDKVGKLGLEERRSPAARNFAMRMFSSQGIQAVNVDLGALQVQSQLGQAFFLVLAPAQALILAPAQALWN